MVWSPRPAAKASSGNGQVAGVDAQAGHGAARAHAAQGIFEGAGGPQRLDRHVDAAPGEALDLGDDVLLLEVEDDVGAHPAGDLEALRIAVDADDERGAGQARAGRRAEPDGSLGEDGDRVADPDLSALRGGEAGRHDVRAEEDVLVREAGGDLGQVGLRVGDEDVLGLAAVDGVAEAPAADGLEAVAAVAALRRTARQAGAALAARRDGAGDDAVAL